MDLKRNQAVERSDDGINFAASGARNFSITTSLKKIALAQEIGDESVFRSEINLAGCSFLNDLAIAHDRNAVGHGKRLDLIVGNIERGDVETQHEVPQLKAHLLTQLRIKIAERFIEQQDLRLIDDGAGQSYPLLLSSAQKGRGSIFQTGELNQMKSFHNAILNRATGNTAPPMEERKSDIFKHRHMRPDSVGLKDHTDVAAMGGHRILLAFEKTNLSPRMISPSSGISSPAMH